MYEIMFNVIAVISILGALLMMVVAIETIMNHVKDKREMERINNHEAFKQSIQERRDDGTA